MKLKPKITLIDHFKNLTDPRVDRTKAHKLIDILTIALCAMICGADSFVAIKTYGNANVSRENLKIGVANKRLKAAWDNDYLSPFVTS